VATASSGLPVTLASNTPSICGIVNGTVTLHAEGNCSISATQSGNGAYSAAAKVTQVFAVHKKAQLINFRPITTQVLGTAPITANISTTSGLAATLSSATPAICGVSGFVVTLKAVGLCTLNAHQAGNATFDATQETRSFKVIAAPASHSAKQGGAASRATAAASGPIHAIALDGPASLATHIAASYEHACAVTVAGAVKCWGWNVGGQLGNGSTDDSYVPVDVTGLSSGISDVAAGTFHTCAITSVGGLTCWGYNQRGELGYTGSNSSIPIAIAGLSNVVAAALGEHHTCVLTGAGGVKCWGRNDSGQMGDGSGIDSDVPTDVFGLTAWGCRHQRGFESHLRPDGRRRHGAMLGG